MGIILKGPLAPDSAAGDDDVRQIKKALNRLGYYTPPYKDIGITGITDKKLFDAIRAYQALRGLRVTGQVKPDDETLNALNNDLATAPEGYYIWRSVGDTKVRGTHREYEGTLRAWSDAPDPGEDYNCRCWAEAVEPGVNPVYPELLLIPAVKLGRFIKFIQEFYKRSHKTGYTDHGALRYHQRKATLREIQEAVRTAKETNNVTVKVGKYGTPQNVYKGANGLTVVEETKGRNAGKIITLWWNK